MRRSLLVLIACSMSPALAIAEDAPIFRAGVGQRDITPPPGLPMWGYAARHDAPAVGVLDPLLAKALVIQAGNEKLAIVATDLGRGPTPSMMKEIRRELSDRAGIRHVLICGSHTHHGPVLELTDRPGRGAGKFDAAIAYTNKLPSLIVESVIDADRALKPARIGVASESVDFNRNRQAKKRPKVTDPNLIAVRIDDETDRPIAVLVNFAGHPTMTDAKVLKYSADYPAALRAKVEAELKAPCLFLQGAAGDLSPRGPTGTPPGPAGFGGSLGARVVELARTIRTETPSEPGLLATTTSVKFAARIDLKNPLVQALYGRAFFPELIANAADEHGQGVDAGLTTILLNREIAIVGVSGEFFCEHANRLRSRLDVKACLFLGYCNGHHFYFPTIEAVAEGGYGAEPGVSLAEVGAGERLMDQALLTLYSLLGRIPDARR